MIVSETPKRSNRRWLQACVLLGAMAVLPLGIASAQDYEAVGKRLKAAVAAGELTGEQAAAMLGTLKKEAAEKDQGSDRAKAYLMRVKKDLGAAVEAGRISKEDAAKRYEAAEKGIKERMAAGGSQRGSKRITREDFANAAGEVRKAIAEGKITKEQGRAKLGALRKMIGEKSEGDAEKSTDWESIKKRIEGAVRSGDMTREEADAKYKEIRERMSREDVRGDNRAEDEGLERRLRAAVEAGKMTREEAAERLEAYKKNLGRGTQAQDKTLDFAGISRRLQAAVAAGELTEKEARAKWEAIKKDAAAKDKGDN